MDDDNQEDILANEDLQHAPEEHATDLPSEGQLLPPETVNVELNINAGEDEPETPLSTRATLAEVEDVEVIPPPALLPPLPERTMKERLVERERQARVETERARLKRQFALSNASDSEEHMAALEGERQTPAAGDDSVVGTVGSSVAAAPDDANEPHATTNGEILGYAMERFLSEQQQPEETDHVSSTLVHPLVSAGGVETEESVVMERFLNGPVVLQAAHEVTETISIDDPGMVIEQTPETASEAALENLPLHTSTVALTSGSIRSLSPDPTEDEDHQLFGERTEDTDDLLNLESYPETSSLDEPQVVDVPPVPDSPSQASGLSDLTSEQPLPARRHLTEQHIQEMAAIEEASIGNEPPASERSLSEVGDLVGDHFDDTGVGGGAGFSVRTQTTVSESVLTGIPTSSEEHPSETTAQQHHSIDGIERASVSSHLILSPGNSAEASVISVTANPPSVIADDPISVGEEDATGTRVSDESLLQASLNPVRNRAIPPDTPDHLKRSLLVPVMVDDFEFDKYDPPGATQRDSSAEWEIDLDIDDRKMPPAMTPSTIQEEDNRKPPKLPAITDPATPNAASYGAASRSIERPTYPPSAVRGLKTTQDSTVSTVEEGQPLLPPTPRASRRHGSLRTLRSFAEAAESVFSSIRSDSTISVEEEANEADQYMESSVLLRAFPERYIALLVTLLVEIPVLMMISGGSDRLCALLGRRRYQLMMGFLPLSSAISGNCGLQASTLTTRAISHLHVTTKNYGKWFRKEVGAAAYLGIGMGTVLGACAFVASGGDFPFSVTIFVAQFVALWTAGCTGTLAPLLFSFIFRRDSGKWGGPLETAIQDIVGSFAMVVLSYHLLVLLGPTEVDASDTCGVGE